MSTSAGLPTKHIRRQKALSTSLVVQALEETSTLLVGKPLRGGLSHCHSSWVCMKPAEPSELSRRNQAVKHLFRCTNHPVTDCGCKRS
jgi:hypothetical protein